MRKIYRTIFALPFCFAIASMAADSPPAGKIIRAETCRITALYGHFAHADAEDGREILLSTDAAGNPMHAIGIIQFNLPGTVSNGAYRLSMRWRTGTMAGTPWAFHLGGDSGSVTENGIPGGRWHIFFPGQAGSHSEQSFTHDLAGPDPIEFSMWVNSPLAASITVKNVEAGDLFVRLWDMSPSRDNYFAVESFELTPLPETTDTSTSTVASPLTPSPVGEAFTIGAYYRFQSPTDNFGWDYAFMDMARLGCNRVVASGVIWADSATAMKNWGMTAVTAYSQLINYPGAGKWPTPFLTNNIVETSQRLDGFVHEGRQVGDVVVGHIMIDEPECREHPEDEIDYLRHWADVYHRVNPSREVYVNHCDPPWIDFHEKRASCSANGTIVVNGGRIADRIAAAESIGLPSFTTVSLQGNLHNWATGGGATDGCKSFDHWAMGPCPGVKEWAAARTDHQDFYDMMLVAYLFGSDGYQPYVYNQQFSVSMVDTNGNDDRGICAAFSAAAHDIRRSQGWPGVNLTHDGVEFEDRGDYAEGPITLAAEAESASSAIAKVIFGKSVDKGVSWTVIEDVFPPYTTTFDTSSAPGRNWIIFRAQAIDADGKRSIYDANLIRIAAE